MAARLLVVEDEEAVALTLEGVLTSEGYAVSTAGSANEALQQLRAAPYDLALLDLRLGDEDGLQVLAGMQDLAPRPSAIVLTGYGSLETAIEAMRGGASDYLLKPCGVAALKAAIVRALQQRTPAASAAKQDDPAGSAGAGATGYLETACQELKTPLTTMIGWTQYARRRLEAGATVEARERLDVALHEAWRVAHLVEAFDQLALLERPEGQIEVPPIDLRHLLQVAVDAVQSEHHGRFHPALPETPALVAIPRAVLNALVALLFDAAARLSPEPQPIDVTLIRGEGEAIVQVRLARSTTSPAMVAGLLASTETPQPIDPRPAPGGLGIGLHLARRLCESHGGRLSAESVAGSRGIVLSVALPLAPACGTATAIGASA